MTLDAIHAGAKKVATVIGNMTIGKIVRLKIMIIKNMVKKQFDRSIR
jgi:hypothetical protein